MEPLIDTFKRTLVQHRMLEANQRVLVGISGGGDSTALLYCLWALREEMNLDLVLGHLNHSARGVESEGDARFVQELGETFNLPTIIESVDVPQKHSLAKTSFQETARNIRLDFLTGLMRKSGSDRIALGHTADDQVETVLMNFLRGSGSRGLAGIPAVRLPFIRPLLQCSRREILAFLESRQIPFRRDSSNDDTKYLRNRVRLDLIPFLEESYNPGLRENLLEVSRIFQGENDWLEDLVRQEYGRTVRETKEGTERVIPLAAFRGFSVALQRRLIRSCIQAIKGDLRKITFRHIESILELSQGTLTGKRLDLPDEIQVEFRGEFIAFNRIPAADSAILYKGANDASGEVRELAVPGQTRVGHRGIIFQAKILGPSDAEITGEDNCQACFDLDKTGEIIQVRFFQPGDRIRPLGMSGTKKVKSLFIDEKIPREKRTTIPILTTVENDIIWVYGTRIAHPYRVTRDTKRVLLIKGLT